MSWRNSRPLDPLWAGAFLTLLLAAAPVLAAEGPAAPGAAVAAADCDGFRLQEERVLAGRQAGLPNPEPDRKERTKEQWAALTACYEAQVARCPESAELRFMYFLFLTENPAASSEKLIATAEAFAALDAVRPNKRPTQMPGQMTVAQGLLDHRLAPQLVARLLEEGRQDYAKFLARFNEALASRPPRDAETLQLHQALLSDSPAYFDTLEARLRLQQGDAAAAGRKLEAAQATLAANARMVPIQASTHYAAKQYAVGRGELLAVAPAVAAPPEVSLVEPEPPADQAMFAEADFAFEGLPLADPQGRSWKLADLEGKAWLVNLWSTSCGPCMLELPHIQKLYEELKGRSDVGVLTLNFDQDPKRVQPFMDNRGYTFPVLLTDKKLDKILDEGIPQNWLVDKKGRIRKKLLGFGSVLAERFPVEAKQELDQLKAR